MSNMSYCRFQNTDHDLTDCADDLEQREQGAGEDANGDPMEPLSDREVHAAASLINSCRDIVERVMEERGLETLDELTDDEIEKYLDELQTDCRKERNRRAAVADGPAQVGDFVVLAPDRAPLRVVRVNVLESDGDYAVEYQLADGGWVRAADLTVDQVKLESEVGVVRS